jgi:hypothetical protein
VTIKLERKENVERMAEVRGVKKMRQWKLVASRPVGRWMATAMKDTQAMKILDWKRCAQDRTVASSRNEWSCY